MAEIKTTEIHFIPGGEFQIGSTIGACNGEIIQKYPVMVEAKVRPDVSVCKGCKYNPYCDAAKTE